MSSEMVHLATELVSRAIGHPAPETALPPAKHTAGPWVGFNDQGRCVAIMPAGIEGDICTFDQSPTEADASLMIAAPELLRCLQQLHDDIAEYARINHLGGYDNHVMRQARAAIALATGGKQ